MLTLRESYTNMKGVGRMHSGGMTTKVEGKEKQSTKRLLENTTLDRARRGDKAFVVRSVEGL